MPLATKIGDCELYCGDCMDILPTLPKVDAVVTDPPYGIDWVPRTNHTEKIWVDRIDFNIKNILIANRHIIWGGQYHCHNLPIVKGWLTWCKRPLNFDFSMDDRSYSTTELAWCDLGTSKFYAQTWDGGMRAGDKSNREFIHPSQKPLELMQWCVQLSSILGETILDPFMGSGTTGVACINLGRKFIGIEKEPKYFDIACKRIEAAVAQGRLF